MAINNLEEAIRAIEELQAKVFMTNNKLDHLEELNDEQLAESRKVLVESERAQDFAKHAFRVDHYGYIWRWDLDRKIYVKTTSRICTPVIADEYIKTRMIADGEVKSRNIADDAVTNEKIGNGEVKSRNIADGAVTGDRFEDEAVVPGKIANDAVQTRNIKDQNVTNDKMKDGDLSWQKLNDELQNIIASAGQHGVALSNEWGGSTLIGLTQKMLSEALGNVHKDGDVFISLQHQIDQIINDKAAVSLSATPSPVFVGVERSISLVATTNTQATSIKIKKGDTELASGSGLTLNGSDTITPSEAGNTAYTAEFTIAGLLKTATKNVVAVYPIKYGSGDGYTDAQTQASVRTTPAGTYNVTVANDEDSVFFVVPRNMNINSAKMGTLDFPLLAPVNIEIGGVEYKYYQSANTYDAGTLTIVIS